MTARGNWTAVLLTAGVLLAAGGLLGYAYDLVSDEPDAGRLLIWVAVWIIVIAFLMASRAEGLSGRSAIWLCVGLAAALYLPKLFRTPDAFIFFDELQHVRSTTELLDGASLFIDNPLNPLIEHYPGLHVAVAGVAEGLGLSVFDAGNVLLLGSRVLMLCCLLALYRRIVPESRLALLAVLLYTANPAFFFFDAQFSYESLALPLVTAVLALIVVGADWGPRGRALSLAGAIVLTLAVITTHHISAYLLTAILLLFAGCLYFFEPSGRALALRFWLIGRVALLGALAWLAFVTPDTLNYLGGDIGDTISTIPDFFTGQGTSRAPFEGSPFLVPLYERLAGVLGVALLLASFVSGLLAVRGERQRGRWLACAVLGALFFVSLPLQLIQDATSVPIAPRIWEFAFIGLAPVAAMGLRGLTARRRMVPVAAVAIAIMVMSGATIRSGDNIRLPGPYTPSSGPRSVTPDVIDAARWLERTQGPHRMVMGDITVANVFGAYGRTNPASYQNYGFRPWRVFFGERLTSGGRFELERSNTDFVVVDRRIAGRKPFGGFYFSSQEPDIGADTFPSRFLRKFDRSPFFEQVYDSRNIAIYRFVRTPA